MFDRSPDSDLVTDLVAISATAPVADAAAAAADLIEQLMAWQRVACWVEANRLDTMRRFAAARIASDEVEYTVLAAEATEKLTASIAAGLAGPDGHIDEVDIAHAVAKAAAAGRLEVPRWRARAGKFVAEEVALALNISPTTAGKQLTLAHDLHEVHPELGYALQTGQLSPAVASLVASATRSLPDDARRLLDDAVTADAVELPAGKAIDAARTRVSELDEYADQRADDAVLQRDVYLKPGEDNMAVLGSVLPAVDGVRAIHTIDDKARKRRAAGDPRTLQQLRADILVELITGRAASHAPTDTGQPPQPGTLPTTPDRPVSQGMAAALASAPVTVQVVISLSSLLGLDSQPGHLQGYGTISPTHIRRLLAGGDTTITRLLCDPVTGGVVVTDPTKYRPTAGLRHAATCRDRHCRLPVCAARIRHLDHILARIEGGLTTEDNIQGLCERSHLAKHQPGWRVWGNAATCVTWQTPTGHTYRSLPPPATGYGTGPPPEYDNPLDLPDWLSHHQHLTQQLHTHQDRHQQPGAA